MSNNLQASTERFEGSAGDSDQIEDVNPEVANISRDDFYKELVKSASGFVDPELQERLRSTKLLVAGCGSIGNPIAMLAIRSGMENITVADPDVVDNSNLARQEYQFWQIGGNKAQQTALNMRLINPGASKTIESVKNGITRDNVEEYVKKSDVIIDGIDIRASDMMYELHRWASYYRKPVIVGYDLAGTAMISVYRYDKQDIPPLNGEITSEIIDQFSSVKEAFQNGKITEGELLDYVNHTLAGAINPFQVPVEQFEQLIKRNQTDTKTPQIGTTARLVSALAVEVIKQILSGNEVKTVVAVDLPTSVRKYNPTIFNKLRLMVKALGAVKSRGREIDTMLNNLKSS